MDKNLPIMIEVSNESSESLKANLFGPTSNFNLPNHGNADEIKFNSVLNSVTYSHIFYSRENKPSQSLKRIVIMKSPFHNPVFVDSFSVFHNDGITKKNISSNLDSQKGYLGDFIFDMNFQIEFDIPGNVSYRIYLYEN